MFTLYDRIFTIEQIAQITNSDRKHVAELFLKNKKYFQKNINYYHVDDLENAGIDFIFYGHEIKDERKSKVKTMWEDYVFNEAGLSIFLIYTLTAESQTLLQILRNQLNLIQKLSMQNMLTDDIDVEWLGDEEDLIEMMTLNMFEELSYQDILIEMRDFLDFEIQREQFYRSRL